MRISIDAEDFVCEPDEFAQLIQQLQSTDLIGDHRKGIFMQKNTFRGSDFVKWLVSSKAIGKLL